MNYQIKVKKISMEIMEDIVIKDSVIAYAMVGVLVQFPSYQKKINKKGSIEPF